jgi:hypothetical protein
MKKVENKLKIRTKKYERIHLVKKMYINVSKTYL